MIESPPEPLCISFLTGEHHRWIAQIGEFAECHNLPGFQRLIGRKGVIGFLVRQGEHHLGFGAYELTGDTKQSSGQVVLRELTIVPHLRRCGFGRLALMTIARTKLGPTRPYLTATVHECNLGAQRWLKACRMPAVKLARGYFGDRDGITFQIRREFP